jgi:hypothetical protein
VSCLVLCCVVLCCVVLCACARARAFSYYACTRLDLVCVGVFVCIFCSMYTRTYMCLNMIHIYIYIYIYIYIHTYTYRHLDTKIVARITNIMCLHSADKITCVCICLYVYIFMHECLYVCRATFVCFQTHLLCTSVHACCRMR